MGRIVGPAALLSARTESSSCSRTSRMTIDIPVSRVGDPHRGVIGGIIAPDLHGMRGVRSAAVARRALFRRLSPAPPPAGMPLAWRDDGSAEPHPTAALGRPLHLGDDRLLAGPAVAGPGGGRGPAGRVPPVRSAGRALDGAVPVVRHRLLVDEPGSGPPAPRCAGQCGPAGPD